MSFKLSSSISKSKFPNLPKFASNFARSSSKFNNSKSSSVVDLALPRILEISSSVKSTSEIISFVSFVVSISLFPFNFIFIFDCCTVSSTTFFFL